QPWRDWRREWLAREQKKPRPRGGTDAYSTHQSRRHRHARLCSVPCAPLRGGWRAPKPRPFGTPHRSCIRRTEECGPLGGAYHLVLPTSAHALNPDRSLFAFRHGVGLLANYTYICLDKNRISRIGLSCGNSQRSSRRLSPSCPLGVCHQAAWEGVWRCAPQAPGGNLPLGLRRLRGGAERIQRRIRPRPFAGELPTEGSAVRTGEQPQGRLVSSDEAGVSGNLHVQERAQERRCIVVAELFRGIGGRRTNHDSAPVHRGSEPAFCRGALSPGPEPPGTSRGL